MDMVHRKGFGVTSQSNTGTVHRVHFAPVNDINIVNAGNMDQVRGAESQDSTTGGQLPINGCFRNRVHYAPDREPYNVDCQAYDINKWLSAPTDIYMTNC